MIKQKTSIKHLVVLFIIGCLMSLIVFNGVRFMELFSEPDTQKAIQTDVPLLENNKEFPSAEVIAGWNLFGKTTVKTIRTPKTRLSLKLIGIISSTADGQARVIVEDTSKKQKHYKVGDKIKDNVTVKSIEPDHIIIIHNARDEIVQLDTSKNKTSIIQKVLIQ